MTRQEEFKAELFDLLRRYKRGIVPEVLERLNDELCDENERLKVQCDHLRNSLRVSEETVERCKIVSDRTVEYWNSDVARLEAQRDQILEALKIALHQNEHDMVMTEEECRRCRAAIKSVEE